MSKLYKNRLSTNSIDDIRIVPRVDIPIASDRLGQTDYRPFEEIAGTLRLSRHNLKKMTVSVPVQDGDVASRVSVNRLSPAASGYTFIPPVSTFDWHNGQGLAASLSAALTNYGTSLVRHLDRLWTVIWDSRTTMVGTIGKGAKLIAVAPLVAAAAYIKRSLFTSQYNIDEGLRRISKMERGTAVKTGAVVIVVLTSLALSTQLLSSSKPIKLSNGKVGVSTSNGHNTNGQSASNQTPVTANKSPAASAATSASSATLSSPAGANSSLTTGTYPKNSATTSGGGSSTPASNTVGSPTTPPVAGAATSPVVNLIPYQQVAAPGTTATSGNKTIYSTSPIVVTSN
jgi:hypothetical protein